MIFVLLPFTGSIRVSERFACSGPWSHLWNLAAHVPRTPPSNPPGHTRGVHPRYSFPRASAVDKCRLQIKATLTNSRHHLSQCTVGRMKTICFCGLIQKSQGKWYISLPPKRVRVNYNPEPRIPLSHRVFHALPSAGRRAPITCQPPFELWVTVSSEYLHLSFYTVSLSAHVSYGQHTALLLPVERGQGNTPFSFTQCYSSWKTGRVTWSVLQVHYSPGYYGMEMHEEPKIAGQLSQQLTLDLARKKEGSKDWVNLSGQMWS